MARKPWKPECTAVTQDGVVHHFDPVTETFDPPVVVPADLHRKLLDGINEIRLRNAREQQDV
ncbi:hypothetical protein [Listeria fleischmannii]|uniref:Uncharacterized protein n=1 Tax=Listeria fleischmannii FSL S10-1203 TaxID=1265822 RepID=W7DF73_9LIST|nr:hypothetical protein [Listeria fleischmannii]EUJ47986.1 hypothetical protein MCOL2_17722 [Listeria fleischmannii FSL S10-1203]